MKFAPDTSLQLSSVIAPRVANDQGWVTVETAVIRLNTSLTPSGRFPVYSDLSLYWGGVRLGLDAVVCVQKYEAWIVEAYNTSTGSSFALGVIEKQNDSTSLSPSGTIQGAQIENARSINATGKDLVFSVVHGAGVQRFWEANLYQGRLPEGHYTPTPTVGSTMPTRG